ncbi:MAG: tRNA (N(6)-L-threonylcarbamoyladenosine(37)-C(2))-methylthiotransferase MtaB [Spirochaetia bacterium]
MNGLTGKKNAGRRIGFHTFGCKLNQYETEAFASSFRSQGFTVVSADEDAEAYIVNTCTVTARADHKARALIRGLARGHPGSLLVVTGCSAEVEAGALSALAKNIVVVPQSEKARLLDLPKILGDTLGEPAGLALQSQLSAERGPDPFAFTVKDYSFHTRAFLKIQDGCDSRCSYCRVPRARGPSASLDAIEVTRRAVELEALGHREIVITGVNISAYHAAGVSLQELLRLLLNATTRVRFRLSSLEPESLTEELSRVLSHSRVCPHFHVPVQSGADSVLGRMKRRYRADQVREGVSLLRAVKGDPFLAADIIVGFPGETAEEFAATRSLVQALAFSALHVFPFSPRPGTPAASMTPVVAERIRYQRARELSALARSQAAAYARCWIGREVEVLLEDSAGPRGRGVSGNYLKVAVEDLPVSEAFSGRLARALITAAGGLCTARFLGYSD